MHYFGADSVEVDAGCWLLVAGRSIVDTVLGHLCLSAAANFFFLSRMQFRYNFGMHIWFYIECMLHAHIKILSAYDITSSCISIR